MQKFVMVPADVCVAPSCKCYRTSQTDMSGKTYLVGVTKIADLTPGPSTLS